MCYKVHEKIVQVGGGGRCKVAIASSRQMRGLESTIQGLLYIMSACKCHDFPLSSVLQRFGVFILKGICSEIRIERCWEVRHLISACRYLN